MDSDRLGILVRAKARLSSGSPDPAEGLRWG